MEIVLTMLATIFGSVIASLAAVEFRDRKRQKRLALARAKMEAEEKRRRDSGRRATWTAIEGLIRTIPQDEEARKKRLELVPPEFREPQGRP